MTREEDELATRMAIADEVIAASLDIVEALKDGTAGLAKAAARGAELRGTIDRLIVEYASRNAARRFHTGGTIGPAPVTLRINDEHAIDPRGAREVADMLREMRRRGEAGDGPPHIVDEVIPDEHWRDMEAYGRAAQDRHRVARQFGRGAPWSAVRRRHEEDDT